MSKFQPISLSWFCGESSFVVLLLFGLVKFVFHLVLFSFVFAESKYLGNLLNSLLTCITVHLLIMKTKTFCHLCL